jgi:hypothetical protein
MIKPTRRAGPDQLRSYDPGNQLVRRCAARQSHLMLCCRIRLYGIKAPRSGPPARRARRPAAPHGSA